MSETIGPDTWITLGSAIVVLGFCIAVTRALVNIQHDLRGNLKRSDFRLWKAHLKIQNPTLLIPELERVDDGDDDP